MTYNILVSDRKQVVRRLEELAGKRAEYTRVPRMAYIVEPALPLSVTAQLPRKREPTSR